MKENVHEKAKKVAPPMTSSKNKISCLQVLPETKHTRSSTKSSSPDEKILGVKFSTKTSNTFPKMSPSRKVHNINIVFPPGANIEFLEGCFEDMRNDDYNGDDDRETFVLKARLFNVDRTTKTEDLRNDVIMDKRRENGQTNVSFQASQAATTPLKILGKPNFVKYGAKSTSKSSQASEVVTTPLNAPGVKPKFLKPRANSTSTLSQSELLLSIIMANSRKMKILSPSILEKSLIFENNSMKESTMSEDIRRFKKISPNLLEKKSIFEKSSMHNNLQESSNPIDLELPLRSKQLNRKKNIFREIVRHLDEKVGESLQPRRSQDDNKRSFVKQMVNALEKGDIFRMRSLSSRSSINDEDSLSESETKSYVTSNSPKDTDYSDYDRRSSILNSDDDRTFNSEYFKEDTLKVKKRGARHPTYWVSIPRSTPLRSSSPLSTVTKLSSCGHSPCISPIKSPNEAEYLRRSSLEGTYKTNDSLTKKLFRETIVIDSGYSD